MKLLAALSLLITAAISMAAEPDTAARAPELVSFPSAGLTLQGWLWKPAGTGPFPAMLYNHGSEKLPGSFPTLGEFWTGKGYVFFVPHRPGHGRSPGEYIVDLQDKFREAEKDPEKVQHCVISLHERVNPYFTVQSLKLYRPLGVVSAISAYNVPFYTAFWKVVPARLARPNR